MPLPTKKNKIKKNFAEITFLIYGSSKIGKSTFCSEMDGAIFFATEPGLNALGVYERPIEDWSDFKLACSEIAEGGHDFKTIIIDTVDNAYKMCSYYICKKYGVEHESDIPPGWSKGSSLVNGEFQRVLNKLGFLPYGLVLISHSTEKEINTRIGKKIKTVPTLPGKAKEFVTGFVDTVLYFDHEYDEKIKENKRVIRSRSDANFEAGDRYNLLPPMIDLDFKKFISYYNKGE